MYCIVCGEPSDEPCADAQCAYHRDVKVTALDTVIEKHFPDRLMTFYHVSGSIAAVEAANGDMWRVWDDGDTEHYSR